MISAADYYADKVAPVPSLNSTIARILITRCPLLAWYSHPRLNPNWKPEPFDRRMNLGSYAHHVLLGQADSAITVIDPTKYLSKQGAVPKGWTNDAIRQARDDAMVAGKLPVLKDEMPAVNAMVDAVREAMAQNDDLRGYGLDNGRSEHTIHWHEGETHFRARLDHVSQDRKLIYDYKTVSNAEPEDFLRHAMSMGYDLQGAFYLLGNQHPDTKYVWIVQEIEPPYAVSFIGMSPALVELGMRKVARAIDIWRECMASGKWPGYSARVQWADPPSWALAREEEKDGIFS